MVTSLQSTGKTALLDGLLAKSASKDFETSQSLSFGEILKVKEKQMKQAQEISATSVAAALAAMQTSPIIAPVVEAATGSEAVKAEARPALSAVSSKMLVSAQSAAKTQFPQAGKAQGLSAVETQATAASAQSAAPAAEVSQPVAAETVQAAASVVEKTVSLAANQKLTAAAATVVETSAQPAATQVKVKPGATQAPVAAPVAESAQFTAAVPAVNVMPAAAASEMATSVQTATAQTPVVSDVRPANRQAPVAAPVAESAQFTAAVPAADVAPAAAVAEVEKSVQPVAVQNASRF